MLVAPPSFCSEELTGAAEKAVDLEMVMTRAVEKEKQKAKKSWLEEETF
jgi:hypothetical protein